MKSLFVCLLWTSLSFGSVNADVSVVVFKDAVPESAIQLYERFLDQEVERDPSLENAHGLLYVRLKGPLDNKEAAAAVAGLLEKQSGIVLIKTGDGKVLAKHDPELPLVPIGNVVRQSAGDLGFGGLIQVEEDLDEKILRIRGILDEQGLVVFRREVERLLEDTNFKISFSEVSLVSSAELRRVRAMREQESQASTEKMSDLQKLIIERREAREKAAEEARANGSDGQQGEGGNSE